MLLGGVLFSASKVDITKYRSRVPPLRRSRPPYVNIRAQSTSENSHSSKKIRRKNNVANETKKAERLSLFWKKFRNVLWRTLIIFVILYSLGVTLWLTEIFFKCRVPHYQKIHKTVSYFPGGFRMVHDVKKEVPPIQALPGLACFPRSYNDDIILVYKNVMDHISYCTSPIFDFVECQ